MFLVFSGEGNSDLGSNSNFGAVVGPMARLVDLLIERKLDYSPLGAERAVWVSRPELSEQSRAVGVFLPRPDMPSGYVKFAKQAAALARLARNSEAEMGGPSVAIMFRDSDGTQSTGRLRWESIISSIEAGFRRENYPAGVPMVPKPKQEAWLLCAKKAAPYQHCELLEEESGNDDCPSPLKQQLAEACGNAPDVAELCRWIEEGEIDWDRIEMPSFLAFKSALDRALNAVQRLKEV